MGKKLSRLKKGLRKAAKASKKGLREAGKATKKGIGEARKRYPEAKRKVAKGLHETRVGLEKAHRGYKKAQPILRKAGEIGERIQVADLVGLGEQPERTEPKKRKKKAEGPLPWHKAKQKKHKPKSIGSYILGWDEEEE